MEGGALTTCILVEAIIWTSRGLFVCEAMVCMSTLGRISGKNKQQFLRSGSILRRLERSLNQGNCEARGLPQNPRRKQKVNGGKRTVTQMK